MFLLGFTCGVGVMAWVAFVVAVARDRRSEKSWKNFTKGVYN